MPRFEEKIIIAGKDCEDCRYSDIVDESKSEVYIFCGIKNKRYFYGQCIPCDLKEKEPSNGNDKSV